MEKQLEKWELLKSEEGIDLKLFKVRYDYLRNPRNDKIIKVIVLDGSDSVNVVPITKNDGILMIEQYRFGIGDYTLEIPGGIVDEGEDHQQAAARELLEETGYSGKDWQYLGVIPANPVFQNSSIHHWLVRDIALTGTTDFDDAEDIRFLEIPIERVRQMIRKGEIRHPHTLNALVLALNVI